MIFHISADSGHKKQTDYPNFHKDCGEEKDLPSIQFGEGQMLQQQPKKKEWHDDCSMQYLVPQLLLKKRLG